MTYTQLTNKLGLNKIKRIKVYSYTIVKSKFCDKYLINVKKNKEQFIEYSLSNIGIINNDILKSDAYINFPEMYFDSVEEAQKIAKRYLIMEPTKPQSVYTTNGTFATHTSITYNISTTY